MGVKKVYYGPFNRKKSEKLYEKLVERVKKGQESNFYYLFPNGRLLTSYRKKILDELGGFLDLNLFTFDDIVSEILEDENYIEVDENVKLVILSNIVKKIELRSFKDLSDLSGFIKTISNIIGYIKRSLVTPNSFIKFSPKNDIYEEVGLIFLEYQNYLREHNLADREGLYLLAIEKLSRNEDFLLGIEDIIIDQFYDFRPIELKILEEISKKDINIYINIPFKKRENLEIIEDTLLELSKMGFTIEEEMLEDRASVEEVFFIENLEGIEVDKLSTKIITAPSKELEVKKVFQKIKEKLHQGYAYSDILLLSLDDKYQEVIQERAVKEKLPLSKRTGKKMIENDFILELLGIFHMRIDDSKSAILNRFKNKYFSFPMNEEIREAVYIYLKELDFNNLDELISTFDMRTSFQADLDSLELLRNFLNELEKEQGELKEKSSIEEYNEYVRNLIEKYDIYGKLRDIIHYSEDKFYENIKLMNGLNKILDSINVFSNLLGDIDLEDYLNLILSNFEEMEIGIIEGRTDGIQVLNLVDIRGIDYKFAFVLGLSQNNYPNIEEDNFFINEKNYKLLRSMNIDVKDYKYKLENEIMKFSSLIASVEEEIYLTYSKGVENESIASIFLDEMKRILGQDVEIIDVSFDYMIKENIDDLTTREELSAYILNTYYKSGELDRGYISYHNSIYGEKFKKLASKIISDHNRSLNIDDKYSGVLFEDKDILDDLKETHGARTYSSSYLEQYVNCPFSFLLERILEIDEHIDEIKEYDPLMIGNIYHRVLKDFYKENQFKIESYLVDGLDLRSILDEKKDLLLDLILKQGVEYDLSPDRRDQRLVIENIYSRLYGFIESDLERIGEHGLVPFKFEESFGYEEKVFIEESGKKIYLIGTIDRIDKTNNEKIIVIDYKSGRPVNANLKSMKEGISLQLPIYLIALRKDQPVAGLYGIINQAEIQLGLGILGETSLVNNRHSGKLETIDELDELLESTEKIIFDIDRKILSGDFSVSPKDCPDYCLYKDICRYRKEVKL